jgi:DNA-binding CsgD family transcriptional regulator
MRFVTSEIDSSIASGYEALAAGDWNRARACFAAALDVAEVPEALDGLGRALWWLRDGRGAIVHRERAYAGFRRDGELARAARLALWLSREYALVFGREAVANGWLARAERLLHDVAPGAEQGWLDLARSERARSAEEAVALASSALAVASRVGDSDLELRALAQLGYAEVSAGKVDQGLQRLDEAMAAATSGEAPSLETFADVCCILMLACDLAGDTDRPEQWARVLDEFVRAYDPVTLLAFCRTCCADVFAANGRVDAAENELLVAIQELNEAGQRSRCSHPAAKLAEIRVLQGRFDEAEVLLDEYGDDSQTLAAAAALRVARGENAAAASLLERRIGELGETNLLAAPFLGQLVEARLGEGRVADAREACSRLRRIAETSGRDRVQAAARLAEGRLAAATEHSAAPDLLREAVNGFASLGLRLDAARARLDLARAIAASNAELAVDAAKRARNELDALGATREADAAAALMRSLGAKGRTGPRDVSLLSKRETEVLRLLGEGLSTRDLAARLYISPKTAEHHVSRIYAKLGFKTRGEAAAYAATKLGRE